MEAGRNNGSWIAFLPSAFCPLPFYASLLLLLLASCVSPPPPAAVASWQLPAGWSAETNNFPLSFAPGLPYRGSEEIRFMPGMYKPGARDFWSYSFVWALEGTPAVAQADLERGLTTYFKGLTESVGGSKFTFDATRYNATLQPAADSMVANHPAKHYTGKVALYDGFTTGRPLDLNTEAFVWECPAEGKTFAMFLFSPGSRTTEVWENLRNVGESFRCHLGYGAGKAK